MQNKKDKGTRRGILKKNFNHTSRLWGCDEKFRWMIRKAIYRYEYMDDWKIFEEISLPPKDAFYSRLNMKGISDQDHEHAQQVWNTMNMLSKPGIP